MSDGLSAFDDDAEVDPETLAAPVKQDDTSDKWALEIGAMLLLFLLRSRRDTLVSVGWKPDHGSAGLLRDGLKIGPDEHPLATHVPGGEHVDQVEWPEALSVDTEMLPTIGADAVRLLLERLAYVAPAADKPTILMGLSTQELQSIAERALVQARTLVTQVNETTVKQLVERSVAEREAGTRVTPTVARTIINKVFDEATGPRTKTAAVTETASTRAQGVILGDQRAGVSSNTWISMRDDRVRHTHRVLDGQVRNVGRMFQSPSGAQALHPGGFGVAAEDVNCRCVLHPIKQAPGFSLS